MTSSESKTSIDKLNGGKYLFDHGIENFLKSKLKNHKPMG